MEIVFERLLCFRTRFHFLANLFYMYKYTTRKKTGANAQAEQLQDDETDSR